MAYLSFSGVYPWVILGECLGNPWVSIGWREGKWGLDIGDWRLDVGDWGLEIGDWRLDIGDWELEIGDWISDRSQTDDGPTP